MWMRSGKTGNRLLLCGLVYYSVHFWFFADTLAIFLGKLSKRVKWPNQSFLQRKSDPIFKDFFLTFFTWMTQIYSLSSKHTWVGFAINKKWQTAQEVSHFKNIDSHFHRQLFQMTNAKKTVDYVFLWNFPIWFDDDEKW